MENVQKSENPIHCANGCGFFGTAATLNMCSKCFLDHRLKEEQAAVVSAAMTSKLPLNPVVVVEERESEKSVAATSATTAEETREVVKSSAKNRCGCCNKKVGVVGFKCRCGFTFCGSHRYPEEHNCNFDFKVAGREALAKENPIVVADKIQRV